MSGHHRVASQACDNMTPTIPQPKIGQASSLGSLPMEIIVLIAASLPPSSHASLALTCKEMYRSLPSSFEGLDLPAEQPDDFQEARMSKAKWYQPERWTFLLLLEKDMVNKERLFCSECFVLHLAHKFASYEESVVPFPREHLRSCANENRTCCHCRYRFEQKDPTSIRPSGIVDLCPCNKLTVAKKDKMLAELKENLQEEQVENSTRDTVLESPTWHSCKHNYDGDLSIDIDINLFLSKNRDLSMRFHYRYMRPARRRMISPRLLCPHRSLDYFIEDLKMSYIWGSDSDRQSCERCGMRMFNFSDSDEEMDEEVKEGRMITYEFDVERYFGDDLWFRQIVFPFDRKNRTVANVSLWA